MFSARKSCDMARGYIPNINAIYEAIMEDTRRILVSLERRFKCIAQQQFIFVTALDRCRKQKFEPTKQISTISQVQNYYEEIADNATDKRIFSMFLSLVHDLVEFRRTLSKVVKKNDDKLNNLFKTWKSVLEQRQDISHIRAKFPNDQVNHLSCDEAKNHFGGIVSVIPVAMDCAREVVERIEATRAYRAKSSSRGSRQTRESSRNAEPEDCHIHEACRMKPTPASPVISSPTQSLSRASINSHKSEKPEKDSTEIRKCPSTYEMQSTQRSKTPISTRPATAGKSTQTPGYLVSTLRPNLDYPHQSTSETEMKSLMHSRKHKIARPNWKP
uniref:sperm acrosome-associated protein 9-like n=1 Tax=Styela clava TaxID=7725 RepID=UPI001939DA92|nr:sperm acrosome-associated protein 9-like [Styela clava]